MSVVAIYVLLELLTLLPVTWVSSLALTSVNDNSQGPTLSYHQIASISVLLGVPSFRTLRNTSADTVIWKSVLTFKTDSKNILRNGDSVHDAV